MRNPRKELEDNHNIFFMIINAPQPHAPEGQGVQAQDLQYNCVRADEVAQGSYCSCRGLEFSF